MGFKENLKSELSYKDILVKELATLAGVNKKTLDNYLGVRRYMPPADVALKIAQALEVSVEYLITGEELSSNRTSLGPEIRDLIQNFKLVSENDRKFIIDIIQLLRNRGK